MAGVSIDSDNTYSVWLSHILTMIRPIRSTYFREYDLGMGSSAAFIASFDFVSAAFLQSVTKKITDSCYQRIICYAPADVRTITPLTCLGSGWRYYGTTPAYLTYKEQSELLNPSRDGVHAEAAWLSDMLIEYLQSNTNHILIYDLYYDPDSTARDFRVFSIKTRATGDNYLVCRYPVELSDIYLSCFRGQYVFLGMMSCVPPQPDGTPDWCDKREMSEEDYSYVIENMRGCFSLIWDQTGYAICWLDESWRVPKDEQGTSTEA